MGELQAVWQGSAWPWCTPISTAPVGGWPGHLRHSEKLISGDRASLAAQMVKNLPEMQETQVGSLGQADSLEKGMATHSSILAWRIPWTEEPGGLWSMGSQRAGHQRRSD